VVDEDDESVEDSSSKSSLYHLLDHYYCPSDDNEYPSSSDDDEYSLGSGIPGLQSREDDYSSSEDGDSTVSDDTVDDEDNSSVQENTLNGNTIIIDSGATSTLINDPDAHIVHDVRNMRTDSLSDQTSIYITYYLKAAALLLNVLERKKVSSRPVNYSILLYYLLWYISKSVLNKLFLHRKYCFISTG
jgi:hypothetical protein